MRPRPPTRSCSRSSACAWSISSRSRARLGLANLQAQGTRGPRLIGLAGDEDDFFTAGKSRAVLHAHRKMDGVERTQTMLENEAVGRGNDRVRPQVDGTDRTVVREITLDSPEEAARSCNPTG